MAKHMILMADIISSSSKPGASLMERFKAMAKAVNARRAAEILSPVSITLGDEFQAICRDLHAAIQVILEFEEQILRTNARFRMRYVLHEGRIDTPINPQTSYEMLGPGLTRAREILNTKRRGKPKTQFDLDDPVRSKILTNLFRVLDDISANSFPSRNREILPDFLFDGLSDTQIAAQRGKNRSQIWKFRKNWNIESYVAVLEILQQGLYEN